MNPPGRMPVSLGALIILGGFVVVVAFELFVHWYMSSGYPFSSTLLHWYVHRYPHTDKGDGGLLDFLLPAIILGLLVGWVGWRWSLGMLALFVVITGVGIVVIEPIYTHFLSRDLVWWLPETTGGFIRNVVFWTIGVCVLAQFGRRLGKHHSHSAINKGDDA